MTGAYKTKYFSKNSILDSDKYSYDSKVSKEIMQESINNSKENIYPDGAWGVSEYPLSEGNSKGYIEYLENGKTVEAWGYNGPKNLLTGLSKVYISPIAAQNPVPLFLAMVHETGHAYFSFLGLNRSFIDLELNNIGYSELGDTEHFAIYKLENYTAVKNKIPGTSKLNSIRLDTFFKRLSGAEKKLIESTYKNLFPVFDRVMK